MLHGDVSNFHIIGGIKLQGILQGGGRINPNKDWPSQWRPLSEPSLKNQLVTPQINLAEHIEGVYCS